MSKIKKERVLLKKWVKRSAAGVPPRDTARNAHFLGVRAITPCGKSIKNTARNPDGVLLEPEL